MIKDTFKYLIKQRFFVRRTIFVIRLDREFRISQPAEKDSGTKRLAEKLNKARSQKTVIDLAALPEATFGDVQLRETGP